MTAKPVTLDPPALLLEDKDEQAGTKVVISKYRSGRRMWEREETVGLSLLKSQTIFLLVYF